FADLKRIAGTSQCVGFGGRYIPTGRIRKPEEKPASPDAYPIGFGMQKMRVDTSNPAVKELLALRRSCPAPPMLTAMSRRHEGSLLTSWCLRPLVVHDQDGILIVLAVVHGVLLMLAPFVPVVALGVWWNSNTISHNFIQNPFFRSRWVNAVFWAGGG